MFNEKFADAIQTNDIITIVDMLDNSELSNIDVNDDDHTYIYLAVMSNHFDVLDILISHGANIHADEEFALYLAVINGRYDMAQYILKSITKVSVEAWSHITESAISLGDEHMKEIVFNWVKDNVDKIDNHIKPNLINLLFNRKRDNDSVTE